MLLGIIGFSLLGSVGAVTGAALFLFFPEGIRKILVPCLVSYATGTLLGAAFLGMIPAGLKSAPSFAVTSTVLAGMVLFFVLEKLVLWRHCHEDNCEVHGRAGPLILIGDAFHNEVPPFSNIREADRLRSRDILIKPLNDPALGPGYMRITTALPDDNRRFVDVLREVLSHA